MIMVDVFVPALNKQYNFSLHSGYPVYRMIEEISTMIAQKERTQIAGDPEEFVLCDSASRKILPHGKTLHTCGIRNGSRLILV